MNKKLNWWLVKIDRIFAWILLFSMFLYFITGYGMTKQIINGGLAAKLHLDIFPLIIMIAFAVHSGLAVRLALIRWRVWNRGSMAALIIIYATFLFGFGYVELFYKNNPAVKSTETDQKSQTQTAQTSAAAEQSVQASEKTFTKQELAKYDGKDGNPAYVAVDGTVYDVTSVFANGTHFSHLAGQDLSNAFYSRHIQSSISKYPIAGKFE